MQTCERNRNQKLFWRIYYANGVLKFKRVGLSETNLGMKSKIKKNVIDQEKRYFNIQGIESV